MLETARRTAEEIFMHPSGLVSGVVLSGYQVVNSLSTPNRPDTMATAETVDLGPLHEPKAESINAFRDIEHELKERLLTTRREYQKHEREYFQAVEHLSDEELAGFSAENLVAVRVAVSAYGVHLFGKVRIPALPESGPAYIHIRVFDVPGDEPAKLHSIHTEETEHPDGDKTYRAIFTDSDELEWFDT
ncbi:hypothetical protein CkaCkLH20_13093 [Colletotrichum karsti]|uniref:Uncharacterized protein n=1 Tax=Colletotrichum karsti TaxID=1095194 RepID=A0A9P6LDY4_9PEZI|nr:uncharacterized protein CkaCkLH20_13093 [Colletotrichum karsti]KAF9869431.1 hypothetical protein CkaCkLH20_13093 [Colletotrichum karsti]